MNLGWYLLVCGETDRAIEHLLLSLDNDRGTRTIMDYERSMAGWLLRQAGYDMRSHDWKLYDSEELPDPEGEE